MVRTFSAEDKSGPRDCETRILHSAIGSSYTHGQVAQLPSFSCCWMRRQSPAHAPAGRTIIAARIAPTSRTAIFLITSHPLTLAPLRE